jgi:hypothetical protein
MSIETPDTAAVVAADQVGRPTRITNWRDLQNELALPPPQAHIACPAGFSHSAPDTHTPYATGPGSLPQEGDTNE